MFSISAAFVTHAFTFFPDSRQHHHYIEVLLSGHMPFLQDKKIDQVEHQPPLYYVLAAPWLKLGEQFGTEGGVLAVRLWSLLLASGVILFTILSARQLAPNAKYIPGLAALIVGMNPQYFVMNAEINNDALTSLLASIILFVIIRLALGWRPNTKWNTLIGWLAAAAFLTKLSLWPFVVGLLLFTWLVQPRRWSTTLRLGLPLLVLGGAWLIRNTVLYGDPTVMKLLYKYFGAEQHQEFLTPSGIWTWLTLLFETYWGRFRHITAGMHYQTYAALKIATVISLAGVGVFIATGWKNYKQIFAGHILC